MHERKLCQEISEIAPQGRPLHRVREELARRGIDATYYEHKDIGRYGDDAILRKDFRSVLVMAAKPPPGVLVSYNEMVIVGFSKAKKVQEVRCRHYGFGL
jgi:hypothetical protein